MKDSSNHMECENVIIWRKIFRTYFVHNLKCHIKFANGITARDGKLYHLRGMRKQVNRKR